MLFSSFWKRGPGPPLWGPGGVLGPLDPPLDPPQKEYNSIGVTVQPGLHNPDCTTRTAQPGLYNPDCTTRTAQPGLYNPGCTTRAAQLSGLIDDLLQTEEKTQNLQWINALSIFPFVFVLMG